MVEGGDGREARECRWCGCKCVECVSKFTCNESNPNCAGCNWICATGDKLCDTRSATLLASPHSLSLPLAAFPLLSMPTKLELIIVIIIGISVKCDLNLIILNYFVTCISFSFSISFSFPFFSRFSVLGMLCFSFCLSFSSHAMPHPLWLCDFSCSVSVSVWFRFFPSLLVYFFVFYWFTRVDSVLTEPVSLLGTVAFVWLKLISRFSLGIWDST